MKIAVCLALAIGCAGLTTAQEQKEPVIVEKDVRVVVTQSAAGAGGGPQSNFKFVSAEMAFGGKVVKGKPYSAEAVTETQQILSDGNRITRKMNSALYRDGEGRTRREQTLAMVGNLGAAGAPPKMIMIDDPVAGVHYVLNPQERTARKMPNPKTQTFAGPVGTIRHADGQPPKDVTFHVKVEHAEAGTVAYPPMAQGGIVAHSREPQSAGALLNVMPFEAGNAEYRNENLGAQVIEGVRAEGTRTVTTIPAGQIGNERPIESVFERWYSPDLEAVVMTRQTDPRMGETVYRLTGIRQGEPSRLLFEVPADFKTVEDDLIQVRHEQK